jgi:PucR C-terminal helix-turn-helix domain
MNSHSPQLQLPESVLADMWAALPSMAERTVAAVVAEVPSYADAFSGRMGPVIEGAVQQALAGFLQLTASGADPDSSPTIKPALDGAYRLGQGEARQGRSTDVLLAAYRVGARTAWRELSAVAVSHQLPGEILGVFAELTFAYIDRLSASSVSGHGDELAKTGLALQRQREHLARQLIAGMPAEDLNATAERASWPPPRTLTAIAVAHGHEGSVAAALDPRTLEVPDDALGRLARPVTLLLVPDVGGSARAAFIDSIGAAGTVIGPARPWLAAGASVRRVLRALELATESDPPLDTDDRLVDLVVTADPEAYADLREHALAPLRDLRPGIKEKLTETLRAWLLYRGRHEAIAQALFVHPQTVRYRLGQLRDLYGSRLDDPDAGLELTIALAPRWGIPSAGRRAIASRSPA